LFECKGGLGEAAFAFETPDFIVRSYPFNDRKNASLKKRGRPV